MTIHLINVLFLFLTLFLSCNIQKDLHVDCEMPKGNLSDEQFAKAFDGWEECLVNRRIKEKSKSALYDEIRGDHIQGEILEGIEAEVSSKYISSKALRKILSDEELKQNLKSQDSGIKYQSFLAIAERKNRDVFRTLKILVSDTSKIEIQYECIVEETTLADICINAVTEIYQNKNIGYTPKLYQLNKEEKDELDKLILNSSFELNYKKYHLKKKDK